MVRLSSASRLQPERPHHHQNVSLLPMHSGPSGDTRFFHSPDKSLEFVTCGCYVSADRHLMRTGGSAEHLPPLLLLTGIRLTRAEVLAPASNHPTCIQIFPAILLRLTPERFHRESGFFFFYEQHLPELKGWMREGGGGHLLLLMFAPSAEPLPELFNCTKGHRLIGFDLSAALRVDGNMLRMIMLMTVFDVQRHFLRENRVWNRL